MGEQQLQQQAEECPECPTRWKWQQVQPQPKRDLCRRSSWEGRLHWRRGQPSRLPGSVREVDCCWTCHLGCWMCKRCSWSLRQDVTLPHSTYLFKLQNTCITHRLPAIHQTGYQILPLRSPKH